MSALHVSQIASLCQQDLLAGQKKQEETESMRLELASLTKRQIEIKEEYNAIADTIASYDEQCQTLAQMEDGIQRDCEDLQAQQEILQTEYKKILSEQQEDSLPCLPKDEETARLLAAKDETEAVIAENLAKREEVTIQLAYLAELADREQQVEKLQATVSAQESELQRVEAEKRKLVKSLELLTAHKQDTYVLLNSNREEQIRTVAQYNQYLIEFVAAVQQVACQGQTSVNHFINQDINRLVDKINIIKQRQVDLKANEFDTINQVRELAQALYDRAQDYGWETGSLPSDTHGVVVNYQNIRNLRQKSNDLLVVSPPGILAKLGLCGQWKKTLFDLLAKAKAMEQLAASPAALREQIIAEIENVLLECRHLMQRIYEACYRELLVSGQLIEQADKQIQEELAIVTKQLLSSREEVKNFIAQGNLNAVDDDEIGLQQRLGKIEHTLQQAERKLQQQKKALVERQGLLSENGIAVRPSQGAQQDSIEELLRQIDDVEEQRQDTENRLVKGRQQLTELKNVIALACSKREELACAQEAISQKIKTIITQLTEQASSYSEIRSELTREWISRLHEAQYQLESNELITDRVSDSSLAEILLEKNPLEIEDIALQIVAKQTGLVLVETREWCLPVAAISVAFMLDGYRRGNLIKEFILKCVASRLAELSSLQGIVDVLKVEAEVVCQYLNELSLCQMIIASEEAGVKNYDLTDKGRELVQNGLLIATTRSGTVVITVNAQYELIDICKQMDANPWCTDLPVFRHCNQQEEQALRGYFQIDDEEASHIAQAKIKEWYTDDLEEYTANLYQAQRNQEYQLRFGEIWVYDAVNNQVYCHVWNFNQNAFCPTMEFALNSLESKQRLEQVQAIYNKDKQLVDLIAKQGCQDTSPKQPMILQNLYGADIRNAFLQAFADVQTAMLLIVPWIEELAGDEAVWTCCQELVSRGGIIFIGWGMPETITAEEQLSTIALVEKFQSFVDVEGMPGVLLFYVGNIDNKMLLVDNQYQLRGSLNWLSYCGGQISHNESVVRVVDKNYIMEQSCYLQGLFLKELEKQLMENHLADEGQCITWFYALLKLSEHRYTREILAEEALEKVVANHSIHTLFKLLAVYVKADEYELGFSYMLAWLTAKPASHTKLTYWLEKLRTRNSKAYSKITATYKTILRRQR